MKLTGTEVLVPINSLAEEHARRNGGKMALTRSMLKGMGLTEEQVSAIIEEHTNTIDGLKKDRDKYKADAEKLPGVQKELDKLKEGDGNDWEKKYNDEHEAFENYKKDVATKEATAKVRSAYRKLLVESGVGDKHIDAVLRVTDFSGMKLDKDGNLEGSDKLTESIKNDWAGFITTTGTKGAEVSNPPGASKTTMTKDEIMKIKDTSERQKAIAENIDLFK
jgi:hypothetical protein